MIFGENLITQIGYYVDNFGVSTYTYYFPMGVLVAFILLFYLHHYFFKIKPETVSGNIFRSAFFSSLLTTVLFLVVVFLLKRFTDFYAVEKCELISLIVLLALCLSTILILLKKQSIFSNMFIIGIPLSPRKRLEQFKTLKKLFNRQKKYYLFILLPFFILFLTPNSKYHYSIVIDNSGSMDVNLRNAVNSFGSVLSHSPKDALYVLSYLSQCYSENECESKAHQLKTSLEEIFSENNPDNLGTLTFVFNQSEDVVNTINQDIEISGITSPLSEMIWQNFLTSKSVDTEFSKKNLVVITDGADNLYYKNSIISPSIHKSIFDSKPNVGVSPREFYDQITFLNYDGDKDLYLFADSNVEVLDANDSYQYYKSVKEVMSLVTFDIVFVYLSLFLVILVFIMLLFINPRFIN